jgi:hypothetical protein
MISEVDARASAAAFGNYERNVTSLEFTILTFSAVKPIGNKFTNTFRKCFLKDPPPAGPKQTTRTDESSIISTALRPLVTLSMTSRFTKNGPPIESEVDGIADSSSAT